MKGTPAAKAISRGSLLALSLLLAAALGLGVFAFDGRRLLEQNRVAATVLTSAARSEDQTFFSEVLGREMPYHVYLPPGYDSDSSRRYPVVYMLHGLSGTYDEWLWYGLFDTATRMITAGEIVPMIIVLPQGDDSYWVDHADGGPRWGYYTAVEMPAIIDARYRTLADRDDRAIGGLSMGADGALQLALNYPGSFGIVSAESAVLRRRDTAATFFGDEAWFEAHDPVSLFVAEPQVARELELSIGVGVHDQWFENDVALHAELLDLAIPHEWHMRAGSHDSNYWTTQSPADLRFFSVAFTRASELSH